LDDIKSRTKSSIEMSRRLIDQSFLRFKATHRSLRSAAVPRGAERITTQERLGCGVCEPSNLVRTTERAGAIHSAGFEDDSTCDHCEGILLNNKAYRVRTQDHEIILLDMIVCYACHLEAKNLGLKTYELQAADGESELTSENNQLLALALAWPV
jgi:hypothetical protein